LEVKPCARRCPKKWPQVYNLWFHLGIRATQVAFFRNEAPYLPYDKTTATVLDSPGDNLCQRANGKPAMNTLRAVIMSSGDDSFFEAQLLELDIAVSASSVDDLFAEIEHALILEYHLANRYGTVPFSSFVNRVPPKYEEMWGSVADDPIGVRSLNIPDEVAEALANVLHTGNERVEIRAHRLAA